MDEDRSNPARRKATLTPQEALGRAIKRARKRIDITQEAAAARVPVVVQSWRRYEWGERNLDIGKLDAIAAALETTRDQILADQAEILGGPQPAIVRSFVDRPPARAAEPVGAMLPIRDRLQAGAFRPADDFVQVSRTYPAARDPRYPRAEQWLAEVVGDSVNQLGVLDGDLVQLVSAIDINYYPVTGDLVEVERVRFDGRERELSIKQVEVKETGILLWPRSTNPLWQEPLSLAEGTEEGEDFEVRIRAKVLSAIRRF